MIIMIQEKYLKKDVLLITQEIYEHCMISNQKDCYRFLLPKIVNQEPLSIELIKAIHFQLSKRTYDEYRCDINQERPGEFKKYDYVTGLHEVGSYPKDVENDLNGVITEVNSYLGDDYFTVASYLHVMLIIIDLSIISNLLLFMKMIKNFIMNV